MFNAQNRIRQLMAERGWTIYRLAQESGLSQTTISNIFKRNNQPSLPTVNAICDACGITLAQFFTENDIKILGSMNSFMRWGLILQLSQKKPLSRHSNWRRNGNPLTGRSSGVNHIHYPRKYHAVTAAALIAEKNKYPRRIGAVENMIHP